MVIKVNSQDTIIAARPTDDNKNEEAIIPEGIKNIEECAFNKLKSTLKTVRIPSSCTVIGEKVFYDFPELENVYISEGTERIEESAFQYCRKLKNIVFPKSLKSIGGSALYHTAYFDSLSEECTIVGDGILLKIQGSDPVVPEGVKSIYLDCFNNDESITSITLPKSLRVIEQAQFTHCVNLKTVTLPEGLKSIKQYAFSNCRSLEEITIPASVEVIDDSAFCACISLRRIIVREGSKRYKSIDGVLINVPFKELLRVPVDHPSSEYTIPESVSVISQDAFSSNKHIDQVIIPETVKEICCEAFEGCESLQKVTFLSANTELHLYAFHNCTKLTEIHMPNGCKSFQPDIFFECNNIRLLSYKGYDFRGDPLNIYRYSSKNIEMMITKKHYVTIFSEDYFDEGIFDMYEYAQEVTCFDDSIKDLELFSGDPDIVLMYTVAVTDLVKYHVKEAEDFFGENIIKILHIMIEHNMTTLFNEILSVKNILTPEQANEIAEETIQHTQNGGGAEFQVMISKYMTDNFGSSDYFDSLKL